MDTLRQLLRRLGHIRPTQPQFPLLRGLEGKVRSRVRIGARPGQVEVQGWGMLERDLEKVGQELGQGLGLVKERKGLG